MRLHPLYGSQPAYGRGQFLCSAAEPVSSPRPALLRRRRAQWMSRLTVAPTLPNTLTLPGHALISTSTVAGSMRWGDSAISVIGLAINSVRRPIGPAVFGLTLESSVDSSWGA